MQSAQDVAANSAPRHSFLLAAACVQLHLRMQRAQALCNIFCKLNRLFALVCMCLSCVLCLLEQLHDILAIELACHGLERICQALEVWVHSLLVVLQQRQHVWRKWRQVAREERQHVAIQLQAPCTPDRMYINPSLECKLGSPQNVCCALMRCDFLCARLETFLGLKSAKLLQVM